MSHSEMSLEETLRLLDRLAAQSLPLWGIPEGAAAQLINVSENAIYLVEAPDGWRAILRIHRENYHSEKAIETELAWTDALRADGVVETPAVYPGRIGRRIQSGSVPGLPAPRFMVLFEFVEGDAPDESGDMTDHFETLGAIAARTHEHSRSWTWPPFFERLVWDEKAVFGPDPTWGDWRDGREVSGEIRDTLEEVEARIRGRLEAFGRGPERYGPIHADMRLANLLVKGDHIHLIDFDDCGLGWYLYDFATAISFIEGDPRVPAMKAAWLRGYRSVRPLSAEEEREIDTFVMLRRMALLAWIGSHIEAPEPQQLAPAFARVTAELGRNWLANSP